MLHPSPATVLVLEGLEPADSFDENDWDRLMDTNLKSVFFGCQEAARVMRQQGKGKIINLGSLEQFRIKRMLGYEKFDSQAPSKN